MVYEDKMPTALWNRIVEHRACNTLGYIDDNGKLILNSDLSCEQTFIIEMSYLSIFSDVYAYFGVSNSRENSSKDISWDGGACICLPPTFSPDALDNEEVFAAYMRCTFGTLVRLRNLAIRPNLIVINNNDLSIEAYFSPASSSKHRRKQDAQRISEVFISAFPEFANAA